MVSSVASFTKRIDSGRQYQRIWAAVLLSLIFHALFLVYWQKPKEMWRLNSNTLIRVTLVDGKSEGADEGLSRAEGPESLATVKPQSPNTQNPTSRPIVQQPDSDSLVPDTVPSNSSAHKENENLQVLPYGMALVFLTVAPSGNVKAITWTQLPPISEDKLLVLEALLKKKTYLASGTQRVVRELVEVGD
jgi:hypothetical protein